jgi:hypothetical protein
MEIPGRINGGSQLRVIVMGPALRRAERKTLSEAPRSAYVTLNESWILRLPRGRWIEKRVETVDLWVKQKDA